MNYRDTSGLLAVILIVLLLVTVLFIGTSCSNEESSDATSGSTTATNPSTKGEVPPEGEDTKTQECEFGLDLTAVRNPIDASVIDVTIAVKDIKRELDVVEFKLNFDKTVVCGVIKDVGSMMDSFMTSVPMYTLVGSDQEFFAPRYEQLCYYDSENGVYECRFLDSYHYANAKPGEEYAGLINDKDLVVTIPFRILDDASVDTEIEFSVTDVFGTTREDLQSVCGFEASVVHKVTIEDTPVKDPVDDGTTDTPEDTPEKNPEDNPHDDPVDTPEDFPTDNSQDNPVENPDDNTEDNTEDNVDDNTEIPPEIPNDAAFTFDIEAPKTAVAGEIIDVIITIKDIKDELDAAEFYLDFDEDKVAGVITQSGSAMDVFMENKPMYTLVVSGVEVPVSRYEQICRYDTTNGVYQCKFIDLFRYQNAKPGEKYYGLINDGDLVVKIQFKVMDTVNEGEELIFSMRDGSVKGTTRGTLLSVQGNSDNAYTKIKQD